MYLVNQDSEACADENAHMCSKVHTHPLTQNLCCIREIAQKYENEQII